METKIINILSFFIHGICKPDVGYLDTIYTKQQKKRIFCIFGIVYKLGFRYWSNDM